ncbi:MAG: Gfo/Idh/MocA family protein [Pseudomonadota bacterium]
MDRLKLGMVGGGEGSFIGAVHRQALRLDDSFELVAGAFSATPSKSLQVGGALGLDAERVYPTYQVMLEAEGKRPSHDRIQCVSIVTPNNSHAEIAIAALQAGFDVICDKPLTHRFEDALRLRDTVNSSGRVFALTHNYTGYPLVKQARAEIAAGRLGKLRKVIVEYSQGWLAQKLEAERDVWRTNPAVSGISGCMGDIGTHAHNLLEYITGQRVTAVCADLTAFVEGRALDDDGNVLLRMDGGARGILHASQVCVGEENNLSIRVYGETGGLAWYQQQPNQLVCTSLSGNDQVIRAGLNHPLGTAALGATRLPGGHPEGFIEAFANIYTAFASAVREGSVGNHDFPDIDAGVRGMAFLEALVANAGGREKWTVIENDWSQP